MTEVSAPDKKQSDFTWRVLVGLLYSALVFQPAAIWLAWTSGIDALFLSSAFEYTTILLFATFAVRSGRPLTKGEAFILYSNVGTTVLETIAATLVFQNYVAKSPWIPAFNLTNKIPSWYAPLGPIGQSFFSTSWIPAILVWIFFNGVLIKLADLSLGMFTYNLYAVEEQLPFPAAKVWAAASVTIAERSTLHEKARVLTICAIISMVYTVFLYGLLLTTGTQFLPVPWADSTSALERTLPGATLGVSFDLILFSFGFVVPWNVAVSLFIGGIATYVIGNNLAVSYHLFTLWKPGMNFSLIYTYSQAQVWFGLIIGIGLAAGLMPILRNRKYITRTFRNLSKPRPAGQSRASSLYGLFGLYLLGAGGSVILSWILAPNMPLWFYALLAVGSSFILTLISARAIAEAAFSLNIPYFKQGAILASGYTGVGAWFAPLVVSSGGSGWSAVFAACGFTGASIRDYIKAYLFAFPITFIMSFIYVSAFWSIAPIPSGVYPATAQLWPTSAFLTLIWPAWTSRSVAGAVPDIVRAIYQSLNPTWIVGAFIIGSIVSLSTGFLHVPFELIGFSLGMTQPIPITVTVFVGAVFGRIMRWRMGKQWWSDNVATVAAGLGLGEGVVVAISAAIALMSKSLFIKPF